ncbi:MAG: tol-pal system protein YbgF [Acidobacteria bacterium]|nr:tol-pal system protein YbgF [Acidobacteriota bacterium]MCW5968572.1 tol-pal system protein YbgF [Blastocatellales bacterium]
MKAILSGRIMALAPLLFLAATPVYAQRDRDAAIARIAVQVEEMKSELTILQRQVQTMQDTLNKTTGEINTLITQMTDNISAIRRAQSAVSSNTSESATQLSAMGERVSATNQRMERLSEQFAQLRKLIEDIPKQPVLAQITPGNAEQLFAAAYADYSRGNYDLALSEFRQYVETYPSSELADNAQYWIGEILYAQRKFPEAAAEFEKVLTINAKGDKTPAALYKRGLVLVEMGKREDGVEQFLSVIKNYANTPEARLATEQLQQIAPDALKPPEPDPPAQQQRSQPPTRRRRP